MKTPQGRYELKFPVSVDSAFGLLEGAKEILERDPHATEGGYRVSSLYFDSPKRNAYWEKLDGEARRRKFRLRFYSPAHGEEIDLASAKMEIKYRLNNRVFKERVPLTPHGAEALLSGEVRLRELSHCVATDDPEAMALVGAIVRADLAQDLEPVNVITYVREAWVGREDSRLRVTIDHRLQSHTPGQHAEVMRNQGRLIIPPSASVLEVKFDHAIPRSIRDLIQTQRIRLRRFSKYAACIEAPQAQAGDRSAALPASELSPVAKEALASAAAIDGVRAVSAGFPRLRTREKTR